MSRLSNSIPEFESGREPTLKTVKKNNRGKSGDGLAYAHRILTSAKGGRVNCKFGRASDYCLDTLIQGSD